MQTNGVAHVARTFENLPQMIVYGSSSQSATTNGTVFNVNVKCETATFVGEAVHNAPITSLEYVFYNN